MIDYKQLIDEMKTTEQGCEICRDLKWVEETKERVILLYKMRYRVYNELKLSVGKADLMWEEIMYVYCEEGFGYEERAGYPKSNTKVY